MNTSNEPKNAPGLMVAVGTVWDNSKLCLEPQNPCYDFGWFSALQFAPLAPEVFADIKTTVFYNAFCPFILQLELSHNIVGRKPNWFMSTFDKFHFLSDFSILDIAPFFAFGFRAPSPLV